MKRIILLLLACFSIASNAGATSSVVIAKAGVGEVLDFAADFYAAINPSFAVMHKDERSVILAGKRQSAEGAAYVEQVRFAGEARDNDLLLSLESVNVKRDKEGKPVLEPNHKSGIEHFVLCLIKGAFNDHYNFGYILSDIYGKNGFALDAVEPDTPAFKAGLQQGDILTHVNGVAIQPEDEGRYNDKALASCFSGEETEFTLQRGQEIIKLKLKPTWEAALLKR